MSFWLLFVLMSVACFRLTRLAVKDDFPPILWARNKIIDMKPDHQVILRDGSPSYMDHWWFGSLVSCMWCASAYISGGIVIAVWLTQGLPLPILWWFAVWGAGAWLVSRSS
jgi:hypothetical protein